MVSNKLLMGGALTSLPRVQLLLKVLLWLKNITLLCVHVFLLIRAPSQKTGYKSRINSWDDIKMMNQPWIYGAKEIHKTA